MRKTSDIIITTYNYKNGFMVDIVDDIKKKYFYAWLYQANIGIKSLLFGVPKHQEYTGTDTTFDGFVEMVEANLENRNLIDVYEEEYMR